MSRLNIVFLAVFVGLLVWITLFKPSVVRQIQNGALVAFRPFIEASSVVERGVDEAGREPLSASQLRVLLDELERERDRLKLEVIQLDEVMRENNALRRALQYQEKAPLSVIAARVMNRKPLTWYNTLVIDKGRLDGVETDCPIIVPIGEEAALVGKVTEVVGEHSSIVLLLTDEMCQVSARFQNSQDQGILSGQRGALRKVPNLRLRYLPKEAEAAAGRRVVSSGTGGLFPPDLLLGEVTTMETGAIDSTAIVKPAVDFDDLLDVFVVLPTDPEAIEPEPGAEGAREEEPGENEEDS